MTTPTCEVPEHAWLVVGLDDILDELNPMNLTSERPRAHEYLPEIPDIIALMVRGKVGADDVLDLFERFFGHVNRDDPQMNHVVHRINRLRTDWLAMLARKERTWAGQGKLWRDIHISDFAGDGNYFATLQNAVFPGVPHQTLNVDGCGSLEEAVARVLAHDGRRFGDLPPPEGNSTN
jgi:hypothetical protein